MWQQHYFPQLILQVSYFWIIFKSGANFESYYRAEKQNVWHIRTLHAIYQLVHSSCLPHLHYFMLGLCKDEQSSGIIKQEQSSGDAVLQASVRCGHPWWHQKSGAHLRPRALEASRNAANYSSVWSRRPLMV